MKDQVKPYEIQEAMLKSVEIYIIYLKISLKNECISYNFFLISTELCPFQRFLVHSAQLFNIFSILDAFNTK